MNSEAFPPAWRAGTFWRKSEQFIWNGLSRLRQICEVIFKGRCLMRLFGRDTHFLRHICQGYYFVGSILL